MIKAHKIRLNPTAEQSAYLFKAAAVARFAWNWGLAEYNSRDKARVIAKGDCLKAEFTALKNSLPEWVWMNEVTTWAYQGAFSDLQAAINRYFKLKKSGQLKPPPDYKPRKDGKPFGWLRFKARDKTTPAFYLANIALKFDGYNVQFDKGRVGWINMTEPLRFDGKIMAARISYYANHWWISVQVEVLGETVKAINAKTIGIDLGIKYLATVSDDVIIDSKPVRVFENPRPLQAVQRKLRRLQRKLERAQKGSKNEQELKRQITKLHFRATNIRQDASHKMTTAIAQQYDVIGVEDLNVRGMLKNRRLSRAISDAAFYEKRRQLAYKAAWNGGVVVEIGRFFASSKMCNHCGQINPNLKLSEREWRCSNCQELNQRDDNASANIRDEANRIIVAGLLNGDTKRPDANSGNGQIVGQN